jgi:thioredoxin-like negative regulator of GroEL
MPKRGLCTDLGFFLAVRDWIMAMISTLVQSLALFFQSGDLVQVEVIARSILSSIPEDLVALQFLGLALYQMGRTDEARDVFAKVPASLEQHENWTGTGVCKPAEAETFRVATQAHSGLTEGWKRIALLLTMFGFQKQAVRASEAAYASQGPGRRLSFERRQSNAE